MKPEQIAAIKKETEVESELGGILRDTRTIAFIEALTNKELTTEDIIVQMYLIGWVDYRDSDNR